MPPWVLAVWAKTLRGGNTDTIQLSRNTINFLSYGNAPEVY